MNPLEKRFQELRRDGKKALIPFIMGGDPDMETTRRALLELQEAGADVLEVGMPFSDPLADGPTIQAAASRALAAGMTPAKWLSAMQAMRPQLRVPVVCLTYWNPILQFQKGAKQGPDVFIAAAQQAGVSGLIIPDLPLEAAKPVQAAARKFGVSLILLAVPTSSAQRLRAIAEASSGFIYYVSVTGTTGARRELSPRLKSHIRELRLVSTKPICVGFGISTAEQARSVAQFADGVIVGSALVKHMAEGKNRAERVRRAGAFLRQFRRKV